MATLPASVVWVQVGGEALTKSVLDAVGNRTLHNAYGPTEVSIASTGKLVDRSKGKFTSIGRPLPNVTAYIVDPDSDPSAPQLCPIGVWGELWHGGVQVTRGYLNRPEKTAEVFISNPWPETDPSGRGVVYRTGDRCRWYSDGEIEFGGRIDFQVKLRGQRIELGEIEHALRAQPGVVEAVVLLDKGLDALVAYVSPASVAGACGATLPFGQVDALGGVRDALPSYMLPSLVVGIDEWPRTASGKIDRKRLPAPETATTTAGGGHVQPTENEREEAVREVFASVLGLPAESISATASFFELGGNSLTAIRAAVQIQALLPDDAKFSFQTLFTFSTVKAVAELLPSLATNPDAVAAQRKSAALAEQMLAQRLAGAMHRSHRRMFAILFALFAVPLHFIVTWIPKLMGLLIFYVAWVHLGACAMFFPLLSELLIQSSRVLLALALKWILVGRLTPQSRFKTVRWWTGRLIHAEVQPALHAVRSTALMNVILRGLGARIAPGALIETTLIYDWDLIELGENAVLENGASTSGGYLHYDGVILRSVYIDAHMHPRSHTSAGSTVRDDIAAFQFSTEAHKKRGDGARAALDKCPLLTWLAAFTIVSVIEGINGTFLPLLCAAVPFFALGLKLEYDDLAGAPGEHIDIEATFQQLITQEIGKATLVFLTLGASLYTVSPFFFTVCAAMARRLLVPPVQDGDAVIHTVGGVFLDMVLHHQKVAITAGFLAVLNRPSWVAALFGARMHPKTFCPLGSMTRPELIRAGEMASTGGDVMLCTRHVTPQGAIHKCIEIHAMVFCGNSPLVSAGATLESGIILGNRSVAMPMQTYSSGVYMGAPAQLLFRKSASVDVQTDGPDPFAATPGFLVIYLLLITVQKGTLYIALALWWKLVDFDPLYALLFWFGFPWLNLLWMALFAISCKWLLKGKFTEDAPDAIGSMGCQRRTIYTMFLSDMDAACGPIKGTALYNTILRALGMRVGSCVRWFGQVAPEPDMLQVGARTIVGPGVDFFTHNLENMRFSYEPITIQEDCVLGERASVMGHTLMETASELLPLSQGMKGITLLAGRTYGGNPADALSSKGEQRTMIAVVAAQEKLSRTSSKGSAASEEHGEARHATAQDAV